MQHEISSSFKDSARFDLVKTLGAGAFGMAFLVRELDLDGRIIRSLVAKRALGTQANEQLRREIRWLKVFRGAFHIVQLVYSSDSMVPTSVSQIRAFGRKVLGLPPKSGWKEMGRRMAGPTAVLEYLPNGTLLGLVMKAKDTHRTLPNRMLWSFFLCMVRACIGIAYPQNGREGNRPRLEAMPSPSAQAESITHEDLHMENIMIADQEMFPVEHKSAPALKVIDFGQARRLSKSSDSREEKQRCIDQAMRENLFDACLAIYSLISKRHELLSPRRRETYRPRKGERPFPPFRTFGAALVQKHPDLDPDLRHILARCLSVEESNRPTLRQLEGVVSRAVQERDANYYKSAPYADRETDEAVRAAVQALLCDACTSPEEESRLEPDPDASASAFASSDGAMRRQNKKKKNHHKKQKTTNETNGQNGH
ncbi:kinase-like domain-containing protein [Xylariomycetidae sp. FL2044]|nr:kinase-like domain-containing protein [Xylariomycetidae sp. FL2044]